MERHTEQSSIELKRMAHHGSAKANGTLSGGEDKDDLAERELSLPVEELKKDYGTSNGGNVSENGESSSSGVEDNGENGDKKKKKKKRETWDNRFQFVLTLVGYAVGLGNVWRFSYLVSRNGGSAFLLPYTIMLFVLGIPLFYLELTFGQATMKGSIMAWYTIAPNLVGIGISSFIVNCFICVYYCVIIAWVFFFFFNSFHGRLPWGFCFGEYVLDFQNRTEDFLNLTNETDKSLTERLSCFNRSTEYYWYTSALRASESINEAASFNWQMFLCLLLAWCVVYLCLFKGIQSSGKIIYFTATFPYVVLICFFFRAVTLPGAGEGLRYLFLPSGGGGWFAQAFSPQVWLEAATQIFFSLGLSLGVLIALASYSKPSYNTLLDSFIVCLTNSFTSIFSSIIVFSIVGFRAHQLNVTPNLASKGPGLAFIVFTQALLHMPGAPFWAVLFFIMLLLLGLDSQFAAMEGIITVIRDIKPLKKIRKELLIAIICLVCFLVTFPFVLGNGVYLFELFDQFAATVPLLLIGFIEFVAIAWVFGVRRFFNEVAKPVHRYLRRTLVIMWKWVGPIVMLVIFVASVMSQIINPLKYSVFRNFTEIEVVYPSWALFIGAVIILMAVLPIPIILIARLILYQSAREDAVKFFKTLREDAHRTLRVILSCRWRDLWHSEHDEFEKLHDDTDDPYQRDLSDGTPVNGETVPAFNSIIGKDKENGRTG